MIKDLDHGMIQLEKFCHKEHVNIDAAEDIVIG